MKTPGNIAGAQQAAANVNPAEGLSLSLFIIHINKYTEYYYIERVTYKYT